MSRLFLFAVLLVGIASIARGQATRQPDEAAQREAKELKWAEGIALDFLEAAASGEISQAEALVGPALKEVHNYAGEPQRLREWLKNNISIRQFGKPSIKSGELSPGGNEAVFRGEFTNADRVTPLTVRVAQDRGVWLVSFIRVLPSTTVVAAKSEEVREAAVRDVPARTAKRQTPAQRLFGEVPDKFHVYVLASYEGLGPELDVYLEDESVSVRQTEVVVNQPGEDVVLVLTCYDSNVWNIGHTAGTRIAGVLVSGYHAQAVTGLDVGVPIVISTHRQRGPVKPFYGSDLQKDPSIVQRIVSEKLGAAPAGIVHQQAEGFFVGMPPKRNEKVIYSDDIKLADVSKPLTLPRGRRGLQQLEKEKKIRPAKQEDIDGWVEKAKDNPKLVGPNLRVEHYMGLDRTWVVLEETTLPHGLGGAGGASFIVPPGVPMPFGPRDHIEFYFMDGTKSR